MIGTIKKLRGWEKIIIALLIIIMAGFLFLNIGQDTDIYDNLSGIAQNFFADLLIALGVWYVLDKRNELDNKTFLLEAIGDELYINYLQMLDNKTRINNRISPNIIYGEITTGVWSGIIQSTSPYKLIDAPEDVVELVKIYQQIDVLLYYEKLFSDSYYVPNPEKIGSKNQLRDRVIEKLKHHYPQLEEILEEYLKKDALGISTSDYFD